MSRAPWLFSARIDVAVFLGPAVAAFGLLGLGAAIGLLEEGTPDWAWLAAILLVDVAHVWSTLYRVYLDPAERRRRPFLYAAVPAVAFVAGVALYAAGDLVFWRVLAYVAVFHFVRQQVGWVALYRARAGETGRLGRVIDLGAAYAATVYPLIHWHAHLPRSFAWFLPGDFAPIAGLAATIAFPLYLAALAAYVARAAWRTAALRRPNPGKDLVLATTAACWYVGIVALDSDFAFTVTNVLIHGVPYFALVYLYGRSRPAPVVPRSPLVFVAPLWLAAFVEELLWDHTLWHDRAWLFGAGLPLDGARAILVPLLAVPQLTHYLLDGLVWRRRANPDLLASLAR